MKWFKHLSNAHINPDLVMLRRIWGAEGYGWWCILLELIAAQVRRGSLSFTLETNNRTPLSAIDICKDLDSTPERVEEFLSYLAQNHLIDKEAWDAKRLIYCPKMKELSDRHVEKLLLQNGVQSIATKNPHRKKREEGRKKSTCVVEVPQILLSKTGFAEIWAAWEAHRREIGKPLKPTGIQKQLKFLIKQPDPIAVIEQSIRNGWQGLFALKNGQKSGHRRPVRDAIAVNRELMRTQELIQEMEKDGQKDS